MASIPFELHAIHALDDNRRIHRVSMVAYFKTPGVGAGTLTIRMGNIDIVTRSIYRRFHDKEHAEVRIVTKS